MTSAQLWEQRQLERSLSEYCHAVDGGEFDRVVKLFAEDADIVLDGALIEGHTAIRAFLVDRQPPDRRGKHITVNAIIDIDPAGGEARAVSDFLFLRFEQGALSPVFTGRYYDRFRKDGDRWLIVRREIEKLMPPQDAADVGTG